MRHQILLKQHTHTQPPHTSNVIISHIHDPTYIHLSWPQSDLVRDKRMEFVAGGEKDEVKKKKGLEDNPNVG